MSTTARSKVIVSGRVQGVGYRYFVQEQATRLGLTGFVSNLPNGDVELEAEGRGDALDKLVAYLRQGPPLSRVDSVQVSDPPALNDVSERFTVRY